MGGDNMCPSPAKATYDFTRGDFALSLRVGPLAAACIGELDVEISDNEVEVVDRQNTLKISLPLLECELCDCDNVKAVWDKASHNLTLELPLMMSAVPDQDKDDLERED